MFGVIQNCNNQYLLLSSSLLVLPANELDCDIELYLPFDLQTLLEFFKITL
jgi:hypothetical protein